MRIVWSLAVAQLRHHRGRWALLVLGIALVVAVPVVTAGMASSVSAQTIRRSIASLDLSDRTLLVNQEADSAQRVGTPAQNDRTVRAELSRLSSTPALRQLLFRQLTVRGRSLFLGAVDGLGGAVRVVSGRLPRTCTPTRCEVVVVGSGDTARLRQATGDLGAVVVGRVDRRNPLLVSGSFDTDGLPLVLGANVDEMAKLAALSDFGRHYAWVSAVDADLVVRLGTDGYLARSAEVDAALSAHVGGTIFSRPDTALQSAQSRADVSADRFGLLGGFAAVLLLGFAIVAAVGLRRESRLLAAVLARRGATRTQTLVVTGLQAVLACVVAAVLGALVGAGIAGALSHGTGRGVVGAAAHATGGATGTIAILLPATGFVVALVLAAADAQARTVWRLLDLLALAALGTAFLAADRGATSTLASSGDPLVVALPVLACLVAGIVAARLWAPAARLAERLLPRRSLAGRIGLLGAIRRPLRPAATVAFLTAAVAAVVFAGAYRSTLLANDADQAAYRVPLDATVTAGSSELTPTVASNAFGTQGRVVPVLRTSAGVTRLAGVVDSVPLLGIDASALPMVQRFERTTGASISAVTLARRLEPRLTPLPTVPSGRRITFAAKGIDANAVMSMWVRDGAGRAYALALQKTGGVVSAALPKVRGALRLVAIGIDESFDYATHRAHAIGEGRTDQPLLSGTLVLQRPTIEGAAVPGWNWSGWGSLLGAVTTNTERLSMRYRIDQSAVVAAPDFYAARSAALPIAVDEQTARYAQGNALQIILNGSTKVAATVVAVMPRMPSTAGRFIVADRRSLDAVLDLRDPGQNAQEFWVSAPPATLHSTLAQPSFERLTVTRRASVQASLDSDPIGRGVSTLLLVIALLALGVAALALVLLVVGERRDGAGELYAWEADGVRPRTLRRMLAIRMLTIAAVGIPVGVLAGLVVARAGTTLVAVDASGSTPTPPLEVTLGSVWTVLALVAGVGAGVLLGWIVAHVSLRERDPVAAEVDLR